MEKTEKDQLRLVIWVRMMVATLLATIGLAWYFYPEPYLWKEEFLSDLGRLESRSGFSNAISQQIFMYGMLVAALFVLILAFDYFIHIDKRALNFFKGVFALFMALGLVGTSLPAGTLSTGELHIYGIMLYVATFIIFNFLVQFTRIQNAQERERTKVDTAIDRIWAFLLLFFAVVFLVIYLFPPWKPYIYIYQKVLLGVASIAGLLIDKHDM